MARLTLSRAVTCNTTATYSLCPLLQETDQVLLMFWRRTTLRRPERCFIIKCCVMLIMGGSLAMQPTIACRVHVPESEDLTSVALPCATRQKSVHTRCDARIGSVIDRMSPLGSRLALGKPP